jgi:hypothetical protein
VRKIGISFVKEIGSIHQEQELIEQLNLDIGKQLEKIKRSTKGKLTNLLE